MRIIRASDPGSRSAIGESARPVRSLRSASPRPRVSDVRALRRGATHLPNAAASLILGDRRRVQSPALRPGAADLGAGLAAEPRRKRVRRLRCDCDVQGRHSNAPATSGDCSCALVWQWHFIPAIQRSIPGSSFRTIMSPEADRKLSPRVFPSPFCTRSPSIFLSATHDFGLQARRPPPFIRYWITAHQA